MAPTDGRDPARCVRVGLISDTHGQLDPRVLTVFAAEGPLAAIVHAGDIGSDTGVLWDLEAIAPGHGGARQLRLRASRLRARQSWRAPRLRACASSRSTTIADLGPIPDGVDVVVRGHSHIPSVQSHGDVLVVNPGSASQRRRQPSRSVAILELAEGGAANCADRRTRRGRDGRVVPPGGAGERRPPARRGQPQRFADDSRMRRADAGRIPLHAAGLTRRTRPQLSRHEIRLDR